MRVDFCCDTMPSTCKKILHRKNCSEIPTVFSQGPFLIKAGNVGTLSVKVSEVGVAEMLKQANKHGDKVGKMLHANKACHNTRPTIGLQSFRIHL